MLKKLLITTLITTTLIMVGCQSKPTIAQQQHNLLLLQNKTWILTHIGANEYKSDPSAHNIPSLQFEESTKKVTGADGCNRIMGSYAISGEQITLSQMAGTQMFCANTMQLANEFNDALRKVAGYQVYGKTLRLLDRHGNPVLLFTSAIQPR